MPGVDPATGAPAIGSLLIAALVPAALNALVRPLFLALFEGISVIAVAIVTLVFQVVSFLLLPVFVKDLQVSGLNTELIASLVYATVNMIPVSVFSITGDDPYCAILISLASPHEQVR